MLEILGLLAEAAEKMTYDILKNDTRTTTINRFDFFKACDKAFKKVNEDFLEEFEISEGITCVRAVAYFRNMLEEELFKDKEDTDE